MSVTVTERTSNNITNFNIRDANGVATSGRNLNSLTESRHIPIHFRKNDYAQAYFSHGEGSKTKREINLIKEADWAVLPDMNISKSGKKTIYDSIVPIIIKEYQPRHSAFINNIIHLGNQIGQISDKISNNLDDEKGFWEIVNSYANNPISNSLQAFKTGFEYQFPYLQLDEQAFSTQFGDGENPRQGVFSKISDFVKTGLTGNAGFKFPLGRKFLALGGTPDVLKSIGSIVYPAETPNMSNSKFYTGSSAVGYTITIELLNTIDFETAKLHKELVELWSHQMGMGNLRTPWVGNSPCIYTIEIPKIRWCPAAKIDFKYKGNGNLVYINGVPYPESYTCTFEVTEFFPPIRTIFHHYLKYGQKFHAINTSDKELCKQITETLGSVKQLIGKITK